jgi:hypothetical protein
MIRLERAPIANFVNDHPRLTGPEECPFDATDAANRL